MLKIVIGISLIVVCTLIGKQKAQKLKNEYLYFSDLRAFCKSFEGNLQYGKKEIESYLNESYLSNDFNNTLNSFISNNSLYIPSYLNVKEKSDVISFFSELGVSDSVSQLTTIKSFYNVFLEYEKDKNEVFKKYYSAYMKIGFSIGFMLMLVVI